MIKTIFQELNLMKNQRKSFYFMWKNKLKNSKNDYSKLSREEFTSKYLNGNELSFKRLEQWERTEQYNNLMNVLLNEQIQADIYEVYDVVREKALQGDDKAIKILLLLQKEFKKNNKCRSVDVNEEDDGLILQ